MAPKIELKWATNLENRGQGGVPHRTLEPKMDQISILGALVALGLSSWRLGSVLGAFWDRLERLLGPNLGPNMEPTWAKNRSKNRSFLGCLLGFIFGWIFVDFGCPNGAKLAPKWDQKSLFTWKGDFSKFVLWLQRGWSPEGTPSDGPMGYPPWP